MFVPNRTAVDKHSVNPWLNASNDGVDFADEAETIVRDRPLSFHWRAPREWIDALGLPPTRSIRHEEARAAILLEAVIAARAGSPGVAYSRDWNFYSGQRRYRGTSYSFRTVVPTIDELADLGLLDNFVAPPGRAGHRQSVFRATPALLRSAPAGLVSVVRFEPRELVWLRDGCKRLIDYADTERTRAMRRVLMEVNEAIDATQIEIDGLDVADDDGLALAMRRKALYRVFSNASWNQGGRLYGGGWQSMPSALRARLRLNEDTTIELDHAQLHPRMLYRLAGAKLDGDAYSVGHWPRATGKVAFNALLNAPSRKTALGAVAQQIGGPNSWPQALRLVAAIETRHAPVASYLKGGVGLKLQAIDADMAEAVLTRLLRRGIPALPVHDSFIVERRHEGELQEAMKSSWSLVQAVAA